MFKDQYGNVQINEGVRVENPSEEMIVDIHEHIVKDS